MRARRGPLAVTAALVAVAAAATVGTSGALFTASTGSDATFVAGDWVPPRIVDVQAANGPSGSAGRLDAGDTLTLTFSERIDPATALAGWDGSGRSVAVRVVNAGGKDQLTVLDAGGGSGVRLGSVDLVANFVGSPVRFTATIARSAAAIVVTLGVPDDPGGLRKGQAAPKTMTWTAAAGPADLAGNPLAPIPASVAESGPVDRDF
jgi:chitinase